MTDYRVPITDGLSASLPVFTDASKKLITKTAADAKTALGIVGDGATGPTGSPGNSITGPTGAPSQITGPTGAGSIVTGPTGAASSVPGPTGPGSTVTGPTGAGSIVTGPTGPSVTGPTGPSVTGPTGPASTVTGPTGPSVTGPTGSTGAGHTKRTFGWTVGYPVAGNVDGQYVAEDLTNVLVVANTTDGTNCVINIEDRTAPGTAGTSILTANLTAVAAGANSSGFAVASLATGHWVNLKIVSVSGAVTQLAVTLVCSGVAGDAGPAGSTGPTGPSVTGPTGAASTVTGPTGAAVADLSAEKFIVGAASASLSAEKVKAGLYNNYDPDDYPTSPNAFDDEFDDGSFNVKWTEVNSPTWDETTYTGYIAKTAIASVGSASTFANLIRLYQAPPSNGAAAMTWIAKVMVAGAVAASSYCRYGGWGLYIADTVPVNKTFVGVVCQVTDTVATGFNTIQGVVDSGANVIQSMLTSYQMNGMQTHPVYLMLKKTTTAAWTSANTYEAWFSYNGIIWMQIGSQSKTFANTPAEVGLWVRKPDANSINVACDFVRRTV